MKFVLMILGVIYLGFWLLLPWEKRTCPMCETTAHATDFKSSWNFK